MILFIKFIHLNISTSKFNFKSFNSFKLKTFWNCISMFIRKCWAYERDFPKNSFNSWHIRFCKQLIFAFQTKFFFVLLLVTEVLKIVGTSLSCSFDFIDVLDFIQRMSSNWNVFIFISLWNKNIFTVSTKYPSHLLQNDTSNSFSHY